MDEKYNWESIKFWLIFFRQKNKYFTNNSINYIYYFIYNLPTFVYIKPIIYNSEMG